MGRSGLVAGTDNGRAGLVAGTDNGQGWPDCGDR